MNAIKDFNYMVITGRRWQSRTSGTIYSKARVSIVLNDGSTQYLESHIDGGGGEYYRQLAHQVLQAAGFYPISDDSRQDWNGFFYDTMDHRAKFSFRIHDVSRERDL